MEGTERAGANHSQTYGPDFGEDRTKALIGLFMMEYTDDPQVSIQNYRAFREKQIAETVELDKSN